MFQISGLWDVRNPIKDTPIHHVQVGSLGDRWFLTHILKMDYGLEMLIFKFKVGCQDPIKDTPIHHLQVESLKDMK